MESEILVHCGVEHLKIARQQFVLVFALAADFVVLDESAYQSLPFLFRGLFAVDLRHDVLGLPLEIRHVLQLQTLLVLFLQLLLFFTGVVDQSTQVVRVPRGRLKLFDCLLPCQFQHFVQVGGAVLVDCRCDGPVVGLDCPRVRVVVLADLDAADAICDVDHAASVEGMHHFLQVLLEDWSAVQVLVQGWVHLHSSSEMLLRCG